jgi:hypothetical protein
MEESGRGLFLIEELADDWGTVSLPASPPGGGGCRLVWVTLDWAARGGAPLAPPDGGEAMARDIALLRQGFPGTAVWRGHQTGTWRAALPETTGEADLINAPNSSALAQALADAYPVLRPGVAVTDPERRPPGGPARAPIRLTSTA